MMMKGLNAALLMATVLTLATAAQTRKPVKEEIVIVDFEPPPSDVVGMTSAAAAVVVAEYAGQARLVESGVPALKSTLYTFRIVEILKLHHELPLVGSDLELEL